ncbi:L,D-transpeptidase family protein [Psychrobacter sp. GP33]|uniref:L,D-transpeptidase family protein n=1 Tax=Psychrobacter sp. GP33 TaxID=2758709 RepID=UPI002873878E|nr:L,D-transpeptidase family protein [Psychrobacter sp. GP33]
MPLLNKMSTAIWLVSLSTTLFINQSMAETPVDMLASDIVATYTQPIITSAVTPAEMIKNKDISSSVASSSISNDKNTQDAIRMADAASPVTNVEINENVSPATRIASNPEQQSMNSRKSARLLNKFLPIIPYHTANLQAVAQQVNTSSWKKDEPIDRVIGTKLQALLNWHQHGIGAVDGYWGKNTRKAMQAFQTAQGLQVTQSLDEATWNALNKNSTLSSQPVLVNYTLTDDDVHIKTATIPSTAVEKSKLEGMYYESVVEGLAEKFRMDESYLRFLNPKATFESGESITVYNSSRANTVPVSRVVADKTTQTLYAYDDNNKLIASYPTTVGSTATPSPTGKHTIKVKVHEPNYTYTSPEGSRYILPPGPNNPVGSVWIGLSEPSYGIHGSPDPSRISRQASAGCVRLTNWDALTLLSTINDEATVEFI